MRRPVRHRMLPARKKLKRRLVLVSMLFCAGIFGVLYLTKDVRGARGGRGGRSDDGVGVFAQTAANLVGLLEGEQGGKVATVAAADAAEAAGDPAIVTERLLSAGFCSGIVDSGGMAALYIAGVLYCFLGLAIVCDEFFQTSLEIISEVLRLTPDVAGATFLAAGSSAPELFTSFADAFGHANSTGTGTIVGSAMFNILVIVALSAAVAGQNGGSISIDWRPVCRDVAFYSYSIMVLTLVFLDSEVQWWEGLIMTLSYFVYIVFMKFNSRILSHCKPPKIGITDEVSANAPATDATAAVVAVTAAKRPTQGAASGEETAKVTPMPQDDKAANQGGGEAAAAAAASIEGAASGLETSGSPLRRSVTLGIRNRVERRMSGGGPSMEAAAADASVTQEKNPLVLADQNQATADEEAGGAAKGGGAAAAAGQMEEGKGAAAGKGGGAGAEEQEESRFAWPDKITDQVLFVVGLPFLVALSLTIPDCSRPEWRRFFVLSFVMSLLWIGTLTHYMVVWVTAVGCYLEVSAIFMGLVILAIGTSVPDALGSMIAARGGEANMAIANAVGSNVFDILIGLGIPWVFRGLIKGEPMPVDRDGIALNVVILFCTGLLFLSVLALNGWTMNTKTGMFLFSLYVCYVIMVVIRELL